MIVLHPDGGSVRGATGGFLGEPLVDRDVRVPPRPFERRCHQNVVVERPQRVVGEPLVVLGEVLRGQLDGKQTKAVNHYGIYLLVRDPRPADPSAVSLSQDGFESSDESTRTSLPVLATVLVGFEIDG